MTKPNGWRRVRRWMKWIAAGLAALLLLVIGAGALYEALGRRDAERRYPPRGAMVDIGGRRMHIDCRGTGSPTVILESGLGSGGTLDWTLVHDRIAQDTRTCAYDRAGIMWSDPKDTPQDAAAVALDLDALLRADRISGPLVLVGHSIGGPYIRTYVGRHGDQVAGLVMVDASHPDQVARLGKVVKADVHPGQVSRMLHGASALSWTGIVRFVASGKDIPKLPHDASAKIAAYADRSVAGMASEVDGFDRTMDQARAVRSFGNRPLIVLTAMAPHTAAQRAALKITPEEGARVKQVWKQMNAEQARLSTRGRQEIVPDADHYIQIDRPDTVIAAVRAVVAMVRADVRGDAGTGAKTGAQAGSAQ